jgi:hypothetical protein
MIERLVKLPVSFLLILFFAFCAAAQENSLDCALADAPRLHGLSLGMSPAEVQSVFGKDLKIKVKSNGERGFFQNYIGKDAPGSLGGVRALYLRFLDGRLYQIEIFYEERAAVPTLEVFAANLTAQLNFPANVKWQPVKNKALIDCGAFTLVAEKLLNPRVELTDTAKLAEAGARRKKSS